MKDKNKKLRKKMEFCRAKFFQSLEHAEAMVDDILRTSYEGGKFYYDMQQDEGSRNFLMKLLAEERGFHGTLEEHMDSMSGDTSKVIAVDWRVAADAVADGVSEDEFVARELERWRASLKGIDNR